MLFVRARALLLLAVALLGVLVAAPAGADPVQTPAVPGPAYAGDFPDPHVLRVGNRYYAYSTTTGARHLPVLHSDDLRTWSGITAHGPMVGDALPRPAAWASDRPGAAVFKETWAPAVTELAGRFVAYYAVRVAAHHRFCISVATAASPDGPFVDTTTGPLVCDRDPGGSIDPFPFVDPRSGKAYLTWKSEGQPGVLPQRIWSRELQPDGRGFAPRSAPRELLRPDRRWEAGVVENPGMVAFGGRLYLFYSGNHWHTPDYAEGVAVCRTPLGPCVKQGPPLMSRTRNELGRAGASPFIGAAGRLRLAYHYWHDARTSYESGGHRRLGIATVTVGRDGRLRVTG